MAWSRLFTLPNEPPRMRFSVISAKKRSPCYEPLTYAACNDACAIESDASLMSNGRTVALLLAPIAAELGFQLADACLSLVERLGRSRQAADLFSAIRIPTRRASVT